jgi:N-acetylneuraminic acid mutarotase
MGRFTIIVFFSFAALVFSCSRGGEKSDLTDCPSGLDNECENSYICVSNICANPLGDLDNDLVSNLLEKQLGTDPLSSDTDKDGKNDFDEISDFNNPLDSDGDGLIDAVESSIADEDSDCIPDEQDPHNKDPDENPELLKEIGCSHKGVCVKQEKFIQVSCKDKTIICDYSMVESFEQEEKSCDYLDNDCDGKTDELLTYQGRAIGETCKGMGECDVGIVECNKDKKIPACSTNPDGSKSMASQEKCDGLDNDCDGITDNHLDLGQPCKGIGECGEGIIECDALTLLPICSTDIGGSDYIYQSEMCDGLDNDCDGEIDNNPQYVPGSIICKEKGVCSKYPDLISGKCVKGKWKCSYDAVPGYEEPEEISCDEADNDCDGLTDEDFVYKIPDGTYNKKGDECGLGECGKGILICDVEKPGLACSSYYKSKPEICNDLDDDCDGLTDNGLAKVLPAKWKSISEGTPPSRGEITAAFNEKDGEVLLFGGSASFTKQGKATLALNDTWLFSLKELAWKNIPAKFSPPPREKSVIVYDSINDQYVLFGGHLLTDDGWITGSDVWSFRKADLCWKQLKTSGNSESLQEHAGVFVPEGDGFLYIYGSSEEKGQWMKLNLKTLSWIQIEGVPVSLRGATLTYEPVTKVIYLFGGKDKDGTATNDFYKFDTKNNSFEQIISETSPPPPRFAHSAVLNPLDMKIIVFGGTANDGKFMADTWIYEIFFNKWSFINTSPVPPECSNSFMLFKQEASAATLITGLKPQYIANFDVWNLYMDGNKWEKVVVKNIPPSRSGGAALSAGNKNRFYLFGGFESTLTGLNMLSDMWYFDYENMEWIKKSVSGDVPESIYGAAAIDDDHSVVYYHGGTTSVVSSSPWDFSNAFYKYNIKKSEWSKIFAAGDNKPAPRSGHSLIYVPEQEKIFLFGGKNSQIVFNDMWEYFIKKNKWEGYSLFMESEDDFSGKIYGHISVFDKAHNRIIFIGGIGSKGRIWEYSLQTGKIKKIGEEPSFDRYISGYFFDPDSSFILVMELADPEDPFKMNAVMINVPKDKDEISLSKIIFDLSPPFICMSQYVFDLNRRTGYLFGGMDQTGNTRNHLWSITEICK